METAITKLMHCCSVVNLFGLLSLSSGAYGELELSAPRLSGFLSAGVVKTDNKTPYQSYQDKYEFTQDTLAGVQLDSQLNQQIRLSIQIIAEDITGDFKLEPEWAYIDYTLNSHIEMKLGRLRIPHYLYSETIGVGLSYPWVRPPAEVYSLLHTTRHHGIEFIYNLDVGNTTLFLQPYVGQVKDQSETIGASVTTDTHEFFGLQSRFEAPDYRLMFSYLHTVIDITLQLDVLPFPIPQEFNSDIYTAGIQVEKWNYQFLSEYSMSYNKGSSEVTTASYYASLAYRYRDWAPFVLLACRDDRRDGVDTTKADLVDNQTTELGVRYDLDPSASITFAVTHAEAKNDTTGLFGSKIGVLENPEDDVVNMFSIRFDTVF